MQTRWYRLLDDLDHPRRWQVGTPTVASTGLEHDPWAFTRGVRCAPTGALRATAEPGTRLDFTLGALSIPYVSSRLAGELERVAGGDIQLLPVEIEGESLFVLNVTAMADCLDRDRSVFTEWTEEDGRPDSYRMVARLVIDPARTGGSKILRVRGWTVPLVVCDEVRMAIEAGGFSGAVFEPVTHRSGDAAAES